MLEFLRTLLEMEESKRTKNPCVFMDFNSPAASIRKYPKVLTHKTVQMDAQTNWLLNAIPH